MMDKVALEARQKAGQEVERRMLEMLLGWEGTAEMRVRDVQFIATHARRLAFEAFDEASKAGGAA